MSNTKHYPTHPGAEHPPIMTCEIPLEEYESLKRENAELKEILNNSRNARKYWRNEYLIEYKECCRQKYKRCLANAEACMHKRWRTDEGFGYARSTRHMNKWLEIAEQFKPNNSTAQ